MGTVEQCQWRSWSDRGVEEAEGTTSALFGLGKRSPGGSPTLACLHRPCEHLSSKMDGAQMCTISKSASFTIIFYDRLHQVSMVKFS